MKLICIFVFAYAKSRFSHDVAHVVFGFFQLCMKIVCTYLEATMGREGCILKMFSNLIQVSRLLNCCRISNVHREQ